MKLEKESSFFEDICFLHLIRNGILNIKNHSPTIGPQILIFSYFDSLKLNIGFSGVIKKIKIITKQSYSS